MERHVRRRSPFLDSVREAIRLRHMSRATEKAYVAWAVRFIRFHGLRHPREMGEAEVRRFLSWLAVERSVAASTVPVGVALPRRMSDDPEPEVPAEERMRADVEGDRVVDEARALYLR